MPTVTCPNCDTVNTATAMGLRLLCSGCAQPIVIQPAPPVAPAQQANEETALLRDAVRSLRVIAMFVGVCAAFGAALMFGGEGDTGIAWVRRGAIFWGVVLICGWIVLTRKRVA